MGRVRKTGGRIVRVVAPTGSRRRRVLQFTWRIATGAYKGWKEASATVDKPSLRRPGTRSYLHWRARQPGISIPKGVAETTFVVVVACESTPSRKATRTLKSVTSQRGVTASTVTATFDTLVRDAIESTPGDFVVVLKEGSVLQRGALAEVAHTYLRDPSLRVIGFDSDRRTWWGGRRSPRFRPSFSPDMLAGANYLGRAFAATRALATASDDADVSDRGLWRLLLSAGLAPRDVGRIPRVLVTEQGSRRWVANDDDARMVADVLTAAGERVTASAERGLVRVRYTPAEWPTASIVIPTRHSRVNLSRLLPSLARTDYPGVFDVHIIDNGGETAENVQWYAEHSHGLPLKVTWWTETPFNYSRVNNVAARATDGAVIVMLNDDTEIVDAGWLAEMVGHAVRPGVGTVGYQLINGEGKIQHAGVVVGPGGFADNLFSGLAPEADTLLGPSTWYRNTLAVTGACVAITRDLFEEVGGLDERFELCGSDVVLGLDQIVRSRRNVVIPFDAVRHFESLTRGSAVPSGDFFASYWRYHAWLQGGDPYMSPCVSRLTAIPRLSSPSDRDPVRFSLDAINRSYAKIVQQSTISQEARGLASMGSSSRTVVEAVHRSHDEHAGHLEIRTINWYVPDIDMPFFGGLNTAFRLAAKLHREHGVHNRFVVLAAANEAYVSSALAAAFPELAEAEVWFYNGQDDMIETIPPADAAVATLWLTAVHVAKAPGVKRRFYLMQDYEPAFYPASSMFAMAEETYRLGLYGICNTVSMHTIYTQMYGGKATYFTPAVDRTFYHPDGRRVKGEDEPVTIFAYARDHFRNCWELVDAALTEVKRRHGDRVRIIAAGARHLPATSDYLDLGLLDFRETGSVYRETDIGLTMQISRHPSYLPLELMACGVPMVAPDSSYFTWLFEPGVNSMVAMRSVEDIVERLEMLINDRALREELGRNALATIDTNHGSWDSALDHIFGYMSDPEAMR